MSEKSYLEILDELYLTLETDNIPEKDKSKIMGMVRELHEILWQYSA